MFGKFLYCKNILILDEGADQDLYREDNTIMYDITPRIAKVWNKTPDQIVKLKIKKRGVIYSALLLSNM